MPSPRASARLRAEVLEARETPAVLTEFPLPSGGDPVGVTTGPDGNIWFTESAADRIGRLTPAGVFTEFVVPGAGSKPTGIAAGPDGNLWFTQNGSDQIGRITTAGTITEFTVTGVGSNPLGIAAGPDGSLWFTQNGSDQIGRITTAGTITEFTVPGVGSNPAVIAAGPDGNLWFTQNGSDQIGRITTAGTVTEFTVPGAGSNPLGIAAGPDGNLWFTQNGSGQIGRITTAGAVTEFIIPTNPSGPTGIVAGPDGAMWFTEATSNRLGRIDTTGAITEVTDGLTSSAGLAGITATATALVFAETTAQRIGQYTPGTPAGAPTLVVSGQGNGQAQRYSANPATGQLGSSPTAILGPVSGIGFAPLRAATADVDGDGAADTVLVTGPGVPLRVAVVSGADGSLLVSPFDPFGGDFLGGGFVAAADMTGDGKAEIVVTPDQGGGPRVTLFSVSGGAATARANFFGIDDPDFRGGARAALGDVNRDGTPDVVVAAGFGGGPRTAIFNGLTVLAGVPGRLVGDYFAFPGEDAVTLRNGVYVAVGDVTGDGFADLVFGGGPGGAPRVLILSGALVSSGATDAAQGAPVANFFVAGNAADRGGVRVAVKSLDGDAMADVATGSGEGSPARVRVYLGKNIAGAGEPGTFQDLTPFGGAPLDGGVFVG